MLFSLTKGCGSKMIEKETIKIENMIYEIRGKQVMLDNI